MKHFSPETVGTQFDPQQIDPPHIEPLEETIVAETTAPKRRRKSAIKRAVDAVKSKVTKKK